MDDNHLRDNIYRLKLRMLNERMSTNITKESNDLRYVQARSKKDDDDNERDLKIRQLDKELQDAKRKYEKLKSKLRDQEMIQNMKIDALRVNDNQGTKQSEALSKLMDIIVVQQSQIQGMITNQMLLRRPIADQDNATIPKVQVISAGRISPTLVKVKSTATNDQPYPGNDAQRSLRRLGLAALFCGIVDCEHDEQSLTLNEKFLFEIKIKEIIATIEKMFLTPGGDIHAMLTKLTSTEAPNFSLLLTRSGTSEELSLAESELTTVIHNLVAKITEIMPKNGTLGCDCRSILGDFLHDKQTFPERYFFQREYDLLQVDADNTLHKVGFLESRLLLIGVFFIRTLVLHELMRPVEYRLCTSLSVVGKQNFKILASIVVAIYITILGEFVSQRNPNNPRNKANTSVTFVEMDGFLLNDSEVQQLLKMVKKSTDSAKEAILKWSEMYVMNLKPM